MNPSQLDTREMTRRHFFERAFGTVADSGSPFLTHTPKVKRLVYLQMAGGAPHVDLFDYKPTLKKFDGVDAPESLYKGERFAFITGVPKMGASPFTFKQYGQSGAWFSEVWPNLSRLADDLTFLKGMQTTQ